MRDNIKGGALTETTFFILLALVNPNHGYGIMQFIEEKTNGRLLLGAGTLYGAINTMLSKGWIKSFGEEVSGRKKQYIVTEIGYEIMKKEIERLESVIELSKNILKG